MLADSSLAEDRGAKACTVASLAVVLTGLGCVSAVPPRTDVAGTETAEIRLEVEPISGRVTLTNDGRAPARLLPVPEQSERPILRVDVRRADGGWAPIRRVAVSGAPVRPDSIRGASSVVLGESHVGLRPGAHRWAARVMVRGRVYEVLHEVRVTGWSAETVAAVRALLAHPDADACRVRPRVLSSLLPNIDPGGLLELEAELRPAELRALLRELIERGGFTDELVSRLTVAPLEDIVSLAYELDHDELETVGFRRSERSLIARRLFDVVADHGRELGDREARSLLTFARDWPESGPESLVDRLERGSDSGAALARLLDVVRFHPDRTPFDASRILVALTRRCADADAALAFHCEQTVARFTSSADEGRIAGPLAATTASDDSIRPSPPGAPRTRCHDLFDAWEALEDAARAREVITTRNAVEHVDPDALEGHRLVRTDGHVLLASPR